MDRLKNFHVEVEENGDSVNFLYALKAGPAEKSFGIQVAKLAGLPESVVERAHVVLLGLEAKSDGEVSRESTPGSFSAPLIPASCEQPDLFGVSSGAHQGHPISWQIAKLDINRTTPLQALNKLHTWQNILRTTMFT